MKISAVTIVTKRMVTAVRFYQQVGFELHRGGENARFSTFRVGDHHLNLRLADADEPAASSTLIIFAVDDVDETYRLLVERGLQPEFAPRDAVWGERYFHIRDPDGHPISFAEPLQ
ncbi:Glyoxalase/bleomycin resistance protein/dioxygenase [Rhodopirellula maiorica SM1]|uniref:Glyoxalase/bleomycin resistance protein/dioxygenase n=1 Tax=Rhodopirellula maiorica SM1 TaxID=1265738 RepID=M5RVU6_9BACT|nr:VOC family protein [Rhodopirellula maiorica]EMI19522.1 Glyoxalase/bleomycin resistance protein/dioxygenase [Rhodopirellula maiorica SM1]